MMRNEFIFKDKKNQSGFTLIEMSIFLIFFGLFAGILVQYLISYQTEQRKLVTKTNLEKAQGAIINFYTVEGRYPCPADPRLGPDDPDYGFEKCTDGDLPVDAANVANGSLVDLDGDGEGEKVMAGSIPFRTIEVSVEGYDLDGTGNEILITSEDSVEDQELVDNLEMKDQLTEELTLDAYDNKLLYAVTKELTSVSTFEETRGAIVIVDEFTIVDAPFFANLNPREARMAHYVIFSTGPDGVGAYDRFGGVADSCIMGGYVGEDEEEEEEAPVTASYANETENCDIASTAEMDAAFISALHNTRRSSYYDDSIVIGTLSTSEPWGMAGGIGSMKSLNDGNVGVGTQEPEAKLHVDNGNLRGNKIKSPEYCDVSDTYCITSDLIASPEGKSNMRCPDGEVIKGIHGVLVAGKYQAQVECESPVFNMLNATCNAGTYLRGITVDASGNTTPLCTSL